MPGNLIGALRVSLGLDTAQFQAGIKKSQSTFASFGKSLALGAAAGIASFVSITSAINGTKAALAQFGKVNDLSIASGLDAETFQALAYQAGLAGISMDQMASALTTFAKSSGQAEAGTGRMASQLKILNPELLAGIQNATTQEQRFRLVADALAKIEDPAQRAALATAAFGEAGTKLAGAFAGGSAQIDAMMVKAQNLGIIVSRDVIARADELGDEFDTASQIVDTQLKQAFVNAAPALVYLAKLAADLSWSFSVVLDQFRAIEERQHIKPLQNQLATLYNARYAMGEEVKKIEAQMASGFNIPLISQHALDSARAEFDRMTNEAVALLDRITELQGRNRSYTPPPRPDDDLADIPPVLDSITRSADDASASLDKITVAGIEASNAWVDEARSAFAGFFSDLRRGLKDGATGWDAFGAAASNALDTLADKALAAAANGVFDLLLGALTGALTNSAVGFSYGPGVFSDPWAGLRMPGHAAGGAVTLQ